MWCYRRMLRIPWSKHTSKIEVLNRMEKQAEIMKTVKQRKANVIVDDIVEDRLYCLQDCVFSLVW